MSLPVPRIPFPRGLGEAVLYTAHEPGAKQPPNHTSLPLMRQQPLQQPPEPREHVSKNTRQGQAGPGACPIVSALSFRHSDCVFCEKRSLGTSLDWLGFLAGSGSCLSREPTGKEVCKAGQIEESRGGVDTTWKGQESPLRLCPASCG